jgi:prepilin-type N-terminal cleavage/methylation domain-containing protein
MSSGIQRCLGSRSFTLIELLIVVAIIAILAAIAVPNFLEAQMRSKVATVYSDFRTLQLGMECYRLDNNYYVPDFDVLQGGSADDYQSWKALTTPVAYLTTVLYSPFKAWNNPHNPHSNREVYLYGGPPASLIEQTKEYGILYIALSGGPDDDNDYWWNMTIVDIDRGTGSLECVYDATNGTKSSGDIILTNKRFYK